ncbi:MAG: hypothetical protein HC836_32565 [Richelia sp. RM2_1_2]|nr:hypothetical protein [Richelia sp. SM1_7_0]NJO62788.1 hypothetical protein [Richelia sp. RM2_1_2]
MNVTEISLNPSISSKELLKIVEKSSSIPERLGDNFSLNTEVVDTNFVNSRIANWCESVAEGNWENLNKRLAWDNLDIDKIRNAFSAVSIIDEQNLPAWANILKAALEALEKDTKEDNYF